MFENMTLFIYYLYVFCSQATIKDWIIRVNEHIWKKITSFCNHFIKVIMLEGKQPTNARVTLFYKWTNGFDNCQYKVENADC